MVEQVQHVVVLFCENHLGFKWPVNVSASKGYLDTVLRNSTTFFFSVARLINCQNRLDGVGTSPFYRLKHPLVSQFSRWSMNVNVFARHAVPLYTYISAPGAPQTNNGAPANPKTPLQWTRCTGTRHLNIIRHLVEFSM